MQSTSAIWRAPVLVALVTSTSLLAGTGGRTNDARTSNVSLVIGDLAPQDSIVITFEVAIDELLPFEDGSYELTSSGVVTGTNFDAIVTDDPDTAAPGDPTITIVTTDSIPTPVFVSDFAALSNERGISVSWRLAQDHGPALTGVWVQRATTAGGPYVARTEVALQPTAHGRYTDSDVRVGKTYWYRLMLQQADEEFEFTGALRARFDGIHLRTGLDRPRPMPGDLVRIEYSIGSRSTDVRLEIFDVAGRRIRVLERGSRPPGRYRASWDRRSQSGMSVAQGLYFARLHAHGHVFSRKLLVLQ